MKSTSGFSRGSSFISVRWMAEERLDVDGGWTLGADASRRRADDLVDGVAADDPAAVEAGDGAAAGVEEVGGQS